MVVHVALNGKDTNKGTKSQPLATLTAARDALRKAAGKGPKRIVVHGGKYFDASLELGPKDSGLVLAAAPGEKPILYGGRRVTGWQKDGEKFYAAKLPGTERREWDFRSLLVNGKLADRARLPEEGYLEHQATWKVREIPNERELPTDKIVGWERQPTDDELRHMKYKPGDLGAWLDVNNAEFVLYHKDVDSYVNAESIDARKRTIRFAFPCTQPPGAFFWDPKSKRYIVWNIREGMTRPGQWYLDRTRGMVVYWPRKGERMDKLEVVAPASCHIIQMRRTKARPVRDVKIDGLTLTATTTTLKPIGWGAVAMEGAIYIVGGENIRMRNLDIRNVGGSGIVAHGPVRDECWTKETQKQPVRKLRIERCNFESCGATAINVLANDCVVSDNLVRNAGKVYQNATAMCLDGFRNVITHNEVVHCPYCGISAGGAGLRIERNLVRDFMTKLQDGGAIYVYTRSNDCVVRENAVYDSLHTDMGHAYYTDEFTRDILIERNLAVNTRWPLHCHISGEQRYRNNIFVDSGAMKMTFPRSQGEIDLERNVFVAGSIDISTPRGGLRNIRNNIFAAREGKVAVQWLNPLGYDTLSREPMTIPDGNIVADAKLIGPKNGRCSFGEGSPAMKLGIKPLDLSKAGPRYPDKP